MELFSLLAKLTLDANDYYTEIDNAEKAADKMEVKDPSVGLDHKDFDSGIDEAQEKGESFGSVLKGVFSEISGLLVTTGIVAAVTKVVSTLKEGIALAQKTGDAIDKGSQKLNLTTKAYQELDYALQLSGSSINDLTRSMRKFTEMQGGKIADEQASAFEKLGIKTEDASGKIKTAQDLMFESLYALADYKGQDRGLLVEALFGGRSEGLNALLNAGSDGIKQMMKEAGELGLVMTEEEVKNAAAYTDATTRFQASVDALKTSLAEGILPLLTDAANTMAKVVAFFNPRARGQSLSDMFASSDKELAKDLLTIEGTSEAALDLVDKLFAMGDASKLTAEQQAEWQSTAQWLIDNIPSLSSQIDIDTGAINANKKAIEDNIAEWRRWMTERAISEAKERKQKAMLEENADAIDKQAQARAKSNAVMEKEYERIAEANNLLKNNQGLSEMFYGVFGTKNITKDMADLQHMMDWISNNGYDYADIRDFENLSAEIERLTGEQQSLQAEADKYNEQLAQARADYEAWSAAIDEMYGSEQSAAEGAIGSVNALQTALDNLPDEKTITINVNQSEGIPNAKGNWYVPYDNYPSLLHRGEMVLTKSQARQFREGESGNSNIGGVVATAVNQALEKVYILMSGEKVGDLTTKRVKRNINASNFSRVRSLGG